MDEAEILVRNRTIPSLPKESRDSSGGGGVMPTQFSYQPSIDGLRAIAVLAVVLYHADILGMRAGYLGVDIFFVISGFLISRIIIEDFATGHFSLVGFYNRRVRRIIPALLVMVATTLAVG